MKLVSWNANNINDGTNYEAILEAGVYGLPGVDPNLGMRQGAWPLVAGFDRPGKMIHFDIYIRNIGSRSTLQKQLAQWFDPDDQTPKPLIGEDVGGANDRYVMGICLQLAEVPFSAGLHFVVTIQVDGDGMWREAMPGTADEWNITATGQTKVVNNGGEMDCYPKLTITPTSNKSSSWPYKRFIPVIWRVGLSGSDYPIDIVNNGLDTRIGSTNFALANGNDLRVWVDGLEVDRWLDGPNTSTTKVWVNLDFAAFVDIQLDGGIGSGDTEIVVNDDISTMPNAGIIRIDTEVISYTSKSNVAMTFLGCVRGAKGTTAAGHSSSSIVFWVQHDIWILYGNSAAGVPPASTETKPIFWLQTSTNLIWDFNEFGEDDGFRTAAWYLRGDGDQYGGNQGSAADPWVELGVHTYFDNTASMVLFNPCGITNANFSNGEHYAGDKDFGNEFSLQSSPNGSSWAKEYTIPNPAFDATWDTWSRNEALTSGAKYVGLQSQGPPATIDCYIEAADVGITLNGSYTPTVTIGAEQASYSLDCLITNETTDQAIAISFAMQLNEDLEVDTDKKTIVYLDDGSNQFQALTVAGDPRRDWLPLQPGNNTLRFDDVGTNGVTIDIARERRFYQ